MRIDWQAFTDSVTASLKMSGATGASGAGQAIPQRFQGTYPGPTRDAGVAPVVFEWGRGRAASGATKPHSNQHVNVVGPSGPTGPSHFEQGRAESRNAFFPCLRKLRAMPAPDAFWGDRWERLVHDGDAFVTAWGEQAARLGWTDLDLFGVHPTRPACRFDVMGLVPLIDGGRVVVLTDTAATTRRPSGSIQRYTRKPMLGAVCLWELP